MPIITIRDTDIFYRDTQDETGAKSGLETIVFAHGLLWDNEMFTPQVEFLKENYRCIAFDFRGQGKSSFTKNGYDMENLTTDTTELIDKLVGEPVHFLGLSMGGFIGLRLAIDHPHKLKSLMLLETTADPEPEANKPKYRKLCFFAKWFGVGLIAEKTMAIMFSQSFLNDPKKIALRAKWKTRLGLLNRWKFARAVEGVIERKGVFNSLDKINMPTMIIVGDEDVATVPAKSHRMNKAIKDSSLNIVAKAGHTSSIEQPEQVNQHISTFLAGI